MLQIYFYNPKEESKKSNCFKKCLSPTGCFLLRSGNKVCRVDGFFNPVVFHLSVRDHVALCQLNILGYFFKVVSFVYITFENCHVAGLVLA